MLYFEHLTHVPLQEEQDMVVASVQMAVIESLTHNVSPFAIVENVVTHADYRNRGYASALLTKATERGCYKIFLETGSNRASKTVENCIAPRSTFPALLFCA